MKLEDWKLIFVVVGLVGVLLFASPAIATLIRLPAGEPFSEIYLLGPNQMAEGYPYNVAVGQNYSIYVGVGNHEGSATYYVVYVKFINETDVPINQTSETVIPVPAVYENRFVLQDNQSMVSPLNFSVTSALFQANQSIVQTLTINDIAFNVNKPAAWNANSTEFNYQLLFELWKYNSPPGTISFDNRYVNLRLNITENSLPG